MAGSLVQSVALPALHGNRTMVRRPEKTCAVAKLTVSILQLQSSSSRISGTRVPILTSFLGTESILKGQVMRPVSKQRRRVAVKALSETFNWKMNKVIMLAEGESKRLGHNFVGSQQLLLGLLGMRPSLAATVLHNHGLNLEDTRVMVEKIIGRGSGLVAVEMPFTPRAEQILEQSRKEASQLGCNYLGPEHLLLGLLAEEEGIAARVFESFGVDRSEMHTYLAELLREFGESIEVLDAGVEDGCNWQEMTTSVKNLCDKVELMEHVGKIAFAEVLENSGMVAAQLEAQNKKLQLDVDQRKEQTKSLLSVLNKIANSLGRIADRVPYSISL